MGKRKLNEHDVPEESGAASTEQNSQSFDNLGLDARLLQGIVRQKFSQPTPVQAQAIPLALEGKDILGTTVAHDIFSTANARQPVPRLALARLPPTSSRSSNPSSSANPTLAFPDARRL